VGWISLPDVAGWLMAKLRDFWADRHSKEAAQGFIAAGFGLCMLGIITQWDSLVVSSCVTLLIGIVMMARHRARHGLGLGVPAHSPTLDAPAMIISLNFEPDEVNQITEFKEQSGDKELLTHWAKAIIMDHVRSDHV
jgi:hypothetical protein